MDVPDALRMLADASTLVDAAVTDLTPARWQLPTPAKGWTIADQIGHLLWTDEVALLALAHPDEFDDLARQFSSGATPDAVDRGAHERAALPAPELLQRWRRGRESLTTALTDADPGARVPWFGPPMRPVTMATARTMETWAHGLDIYDALGLALPETQALAAVARIGIRTREFSFSVHGLPVPAADVRVQLTLPNGEHVAAGPEDAPERVSGSAWYFAAVVTQRRNVADVGLTVVGPGAAEWMRVAQAFAGAPTFGPRSQTESPRV